MKSFSLLLTLTVIFATSFAHSDRRNNFVTKGIKGAAAAAAPVLKAAAITGAKAAGNAVLSAAKAKLNKRRLGAKTDAALALAKKAAAALKPVLKKAAITGAKAAGNAVLSAAKAKLNKRRMLSN